MRFITLTTSHNRAQKTLSCLKSLCNIALPGVQFTHVLVDDGSCDGTAQAVASHCPEVILVSGSGNEYWAGGMRLGWCRAVSHLSFDALFVYNDDVQFDSQRLSEFFECMATMLRNNIPCDILVGSLTDSNGNLSYGGLLLDKGFHPLRMHTQYPDDSSLIKVDTMNMNACIISNHCLRNYGFLESYFVHSGADIEYGLRVSKRGGAVQLFTSIVGVCDKNNAIGTSGEKGISPIESLKRFVSIKEQPLRVRWKLYKTYGGALFPIFFIAPYINFFIRYVRNN